MRKCLEWSMRAAGHLLGVFFLWCTMMFWVLRDTGMSLAQVTQATSDGRVVESTSADVWVFLLCAGVLWCFMAYVWSSWSRRGRVRARMIVRQAGTALTEFIIVIPIFLLLTFGLAQLMLNSMAGLLASLGAFQAGRTAMLWEQEGVPQSEVNERARVAAASVMVPVASTRATLCNGSEGGIFVAKLSAMSQTVGGQAISNASGLQNALQTGNLSFWSALDGQATFAQRVTTKFGAAFCSTEVTANGANITMVYRHHITMPLVGSIFGELQSGAGYFASIDREFEGLPSQVAPNFSSPLSLFSLVSQAGSAAGFNGAFTDYATGS